MTRNDRNLYRVYSLTADGRKVYLSKRGLIHLLSRGDAETAVRLAKSAHDVMVDELVYTLDLGWYLNRSLCLESLSPFVRVVDTVMEPADTPVDPAAFVLGGRPASEVGTHSKI
jgi:hypothetical protein